ncbi:MAG: YigZ family protein [Treponemataceae bacterium]|nr:YigZ family protein [Treponemataceae bacterium]
MNRLSEYCTFELEVKKSRFIAELFPVETQNEARTLIKNQKEKYFDARHVVHAFVIGDNGEILGCSDDGEPGGTAGRPALDVLKGSGITYCILTVTRYFGGTLLGTGGLVKAYGDSAKGVLALAQSKPIVKTVSFCFSTGYDFYENAKKICLRYGSEDLSEDFQTDIKISGLVPEQNFESLASEILNTSNGKVRVSAL